MPASSEVTATWYEQLTVRRPRRKPASRLRRASARTSSGRAGVTPLRSRMISVPRRAPPRTRLASEMRLSSVGDDAAGARAAGLMLPPDRRRMRDHPRDHRLRLVADPIAAVEVQVDDFLGGGGAALQERNGVVAGEDDSIRISGQVGSQNLERAGVSGAHPDGARDQLVGRAARGDRRLLHLLSRCDER